MSTIDNRLHVPASKTVPVRPVPAQSPPMYVELAQKLLNQITEEKLRPGDRLGTETELVEKHGVSRFTVRHALSMLAKEGYVSRERARGTFVKATPDRIRPLRRVRGTAVIICSNEQASHADEDFAFATVLRALERTLSRQGFLVQILGVGEDADADRARLQRLLASDDLEGFIPIGDCLGPYRELVKDHLVVTSCSFYASSLPMVGEDISVVCRTCVDYLLERGHRTIALVCGSWVDVTAFGLFAEAHRAAMQERCVPWHRDLLYHAYPSESLVELARAALTSPRRPTAVLAENWRVCEAVMDAARELDLRVPEDVSVVGYGQNVLKIVSPVAVTAYVPDSEAVGAKAAELLASLLDGEPAPEGPVLMSGRLVERDSVRTLITEGLTGQTESQS